MCRCDEKGCVLFLCVLALSLLSSCCKPGSFGGPGVLFLQLRLQSQLQMHLESKARSAFHTHYAVRALFRRRPRIVHCSCCWCVSSSGVWDHFLDLLRPGIINGEAHQTGSARAGIRRLKACK